MRVFVILSLVIVAICCTVDAAASREKVTPVPGKPDYCPKTSYTDGEMKVGTVTQFKDGCGQVSCEKNGDDLFLSQESCGVAAPPPGCTMKPGVGDYPKCCPVPDCK